MSFCPCLFTKWGKDSAKGSQKSMKWDRISEIWEWKWRKIYVILPFRLHHLIQAIYRFPLPSWSLSIHSVSLRYSFTVFHPITNCPSSITTKMAPISHSFASVSRIRSSFFAQCESIFHLSVFSRCHGPECPSARMLNCFFSCGHSVYHSRRGWRDECLWSDPPLLSMTELSSYSRSETRKERNVRDV